MEEEGVPSTALREVSLLQMLNESNHVVKYASLSSCFGSHTLAGLSQDGAAVPAGSYVSSMWRSTTSLACIW